MWRCSVRNKKVNCLATVKQIGDTFQAGPKAHIHTSVLGGAIAAKIEKEIKTKAKDNLFTPTPKITEEVVKKLLPVKAPCEALKPLDYYNRNANNARKKVRPLDPVGTEFELDEKHLPDNFLRGDLTVSATRFLIHNYHS